MDPLSWAPTLHVKYWEVVKELKLSYYDSDTILITIYPYYGNLTYVPEQQPRKQDGWALFRSFGP